MTEKERNKKITSWKIASICMLVVVIAMNMFSWVTVIGPTNELDRVYDEFEMILDRMEDDDNLEFMEMELDELGIDATVEELVSSVEKTINPIKDLRLSPVDIAVATIGFNEIIGYLSDEMVDDLDLNIGSSGGEEELMLARAMISVGLTLVSITLFSAVLHIILHLFNRKGLGISVPIFTFLTILFMAFVWFAVLALVIEAGGMAIPTLAPLVAFVCAILASVFWGNARKYLKMVVVVPEQVQQVAPVVEPVVAPVAAPVVEPVVTPVAEPTEEVEVAPVEEVVEEPAPVVQSSPKFCAHCGSPVAAGTKFCTKCGAALQ